MSRHDAALEARPGDRARNESEVTLRQWLVARDPPVPEALLRHLGGGERTVSTSAEILDALLSEARSALRDACAGAGERRGAFNLLAADAYLTYACELALEQGDPAGHLRLMVAWVTREAEEG